MVPRDLDASVSSDSQLPLYGKDIAASQSVSTRRWLSFLLAVACVGSLFIWTSHQEIHNSTPLQDVYLSTGHNILSPRGVSPNPAVLVQAKHGAVAAENKRCSDIGVQTLKYGGNAVDATIATTFCTGVVNMFSSGIGGGGFMTVRIPPSSPRGTSKVYTIDFRERAPALSNATMYRDNPILSSIGGLSVGVPGELLGLWEAHSRWGKLSWHRLVDPSIQLAKGWTVDRELAKRIPMYPDLLLNNPDWSPIFAPNGKLLKEGEPIQRTNLSRTLSLIAKEGAKAFYKGPIGDSIVRKVRATGGILSHADLANYSVKVRLALQGTYRGKKIYTPHPPGSGPVLLHMFNLLEKYDMKERNTLNIHRVVEIIKFGFASRTKICDPDYNNNTARMAIIPTKEFADQVAKNITDDRTHPIEYYNPEFDVITDHGTTQISVLDKNGMAVALTSTVNLVFGSQVLDPNTGIILNDEMDDFATPGVPNGFGLWPSPFNYPEAGKRPLSSTTPTIVENADGTFALAIGGSGGSRIFGAVFQTILNNLDLGLDLSASIEFGRVHDQLLPLITEVDDIYPKEIADGLLALGHNVSVLDNNRGTAAVQAVAKVGNTIFAASDSRKNGIAAGY